MKYWLEYFITFQVINNMMDSSYIVNRQYSKDVMHTHTHIYIYIYIYIYMWVCVWMTIYIYIGIQVAV